MERELLFSIVHDRKEQLQKLAVQRGVAVGGTRKEILNRLMHHIFPENPPSSRNREKSTTCSLHPALLRMIADYICDSKRCPYEWFQCIKSLTYVCSGWYKSIKCQSFKAYSHANVIGIYPVIKQIPFIIELCRQRTKLQSLCIHLHEGEIGLMLALLQQCDFSHLENLCLELFDGLNPYTLRNSLGNDIIDVNSPIGISHRQNIEQQLSSIGINPRIWGSFMDRPWGSPFIHDVFSILGSSNLSRLTKFRIRTQYRDNDATQAIETFRLIAECCPALTNLDVSVIITIEIVDMIICMENLVELRLSDINCGGRSNRQNEGLNHLFASHRTLKSMRVNSCHAGHINAPFLEKLCIYIKFYHTTYLVAPNLLQLSMGFLVLEDCCWYVRVIKGCPNLQRFRFETYCNLRGERQRVFENINELDDGTKQSLFCRSSLCKRRCCACAGAPQDDVHNFYNE